MLFSYIFQPSLVIVVFAKVNDIAFLIYTSSRDQRSCDPMAAYRFIFPNTFGLHVLFENIENW